MSFKISTWLQWFLGAAVLLVGFDITRPLVNRPRENPRRMKCQSNLKAIMLAVGQYNQDFDARFPSLDTPAGWRDAITPYVKNARIYQCPGDSDATPQSADYWFNARLSGIETASLGLAAKTVALGDGDASADPRVALSQIPKSWLDDDKSPARRHLDGANFAFADGHVKWLRPEKITGQKPHPHNALTFAPY